MPKPKKTRIKAVLFDLGKVLLDFNFDPAFERLEKVSGVDTKEIEDYFVSSGLEVLYDGGKISSWDFYSEVRKALGIRVSYARFRSIWNGIFTPKKRMISLVRRLKKGYRLVLISNTNQMHYEHIRRRYRVLDLFDKHVLSFKEKTRKPDERIYRTALKACRARAHEVFYIDDRADLTEAAAALGLHVFTFKNNPDELFDKMRELGIL